MLAAIQVYIYIYILCPPGHLKPWHSPEIKEPPGSVTGCQRGHSVYRNWLMSGAIGMPKGRHSRKHV